MFLRNKRINVIKGERDRKGKMTWSHEAQRIYSLQRTKWTLDVASLVKIRKTAVEQRQEAAFKDLDPLYSSR